MDSAYEGISKKFLKKYNALINTVLIYEDIDLVKPFVDYINYLAFEILKIHYSNRVGIKLTRDVILARETNKMLYILNKIREHYLVIYDDDTIRKIRELVIESIVLQFSDIYKNDYVPSSELEDFSYIEFIMDFYEALELMNNIYTLTFTVQMDEFYIENMLSDIKRLIKNMNTITMRINLWLNK